MAKSNTSKHLLDDDRFVIVYQSLAVKFGLDRAVFIQRLHFWLNTESGKLINDRRWIFNTYKKWQEQMPWWSLNKVIRIINALEDLGVIVSKQPEMNKGNVIKYYTIDYERLDQYLDGIEVIHKKKLSTPIYPK